VERLVNLIRQVLNNPGYREKAHSFQEIMAGSRGLDTAADLVEQAFQAALDKSSFG